MMQKIDAEHLDHPAKGVVDMTAIIDVYSRFIVGWSLHNSLDASHCIEVLQNAIATYGLPEIINSYQGCQFTYYHAAYSLFLDYNGLVNPSYYDDRAYGQSVRCLQE